MSPASRAIPARVRFLTIEEGGRMSWPEDGFRPQLKLGDVSTSCIVRSASGARQFEPGIEHEVVLELMHWDHYADVIDFSQPVVLLEGSHVIAMGEFAAAPSSDDD